MSFSYIAIDPGGGERRGTLNVADQIEALKRIREMGLYPTRVIQERVSADPLKKRPQRRCAHVLTLEFNLRVRTRTLSVFTRQLATLVGAGMPLPRGLRTLQEQERSAGMRRVLAQISGAIENGSTLTESLSSHPRVFNRLYVNMVRAGEIGGSLDASLQALADFMEKSARLKGRIRAALFYPCSVVLVALGILTVMISFVVPKFKAVFDGLMNGMPFPPFTRFVLGISDLVRHNFPLASTGLGLVAVGFVLALRTDFGRWIVDRAKLAAPLIGPVYQKAAISRFSRTLGTMMRSGVPILQALAIVRETSGNVVLGRVITRVRDCVKEGDPIAPALKASGVFPIMVAGMVDIGEQTGALPDLLMKVADIYDGEVDNAVSAMTSLIEPIMIVLLAVLVGSIVIAMFMPLIAVMEHGFDSHGADADN